MDNIRLVNIYKAFGEKIIFEAYNKSFSLGEINVIMEPSGWGKTTLLRLLLGLEKADAGDILGIEGIRFSVVFQEDRLIDSLSVESNIKIANKGLDSPMLKEALSRVGLEDRGEDIVEKLSGGEKRRVSLVRALLHDYDVLILDEAFKGLDTEMKLKAMEYVKESLKGRTAIVVSHDEMEARYLLGQG